MFFPSSCGALLQVSLLVVLSSCDGFTRSPIQRVGFLTSSNSNDGAILLKKSLGRPLPFVPKIVGSSKRRADGDDVRCYNKMNGNFDIDVEDLRSADDNTHISTTTNRTPTTNANNLFSSAGNSMLQFMAILTFTACSTLMHAEPAQAVLGAGSAVVSSPTVVRAITLDEFLNFPEKKQRQYEGGFLSCSYDTNPSPAASFFKSIPTEILKLNNKDTEAQPTTTTTPTKIKARLCRPTNIIDELLKEIDVLSEIDPDRADQFKQVAQNLVARQRLMNRQSMEAQLAKQPGVIYFGCALLASCIATSIMHPIDTLKVRLISKQKSSEGESDTDKDPTMLPLVMDAVVDTPADTDTDVKTDDGAAIKTDDHTDVEAGDSSSINPAVPSLSPTPELQSSSPLAFIADLYDGILFNLLKEGPSCALYLGVYEFSRAKLVMVPGIQDNALLVYLLAGSIGELVGSVVRSPSEAIKVRVQTGMFDVPGAVKNVFLTKEGRANTFLAWSAGVFRDVPHGAVLIAIFELSKTYIVDSSIDIDVNTLLSEAVLGAIGGGVGAFISTPSDVVTTTIITSAENGKEPPNALEVLKDLWSDGGLSSIFAGYGERVIYWSCSYAIFLSAYCSLRQNALQLFN